MVQEMMKTKKFDQNMQGFKAQLTLKEINTGKE